MGRKRDLVSKTASKMARPVKKIRAKKSQKYQVSPKLTILMFHRICDDTPANAAERDMMMTTKTFRRYCEFFRERFLICSLHEAKELLKKPLKKPLMVFTFDDGYENYHALAFPIMQELGVKSNQNIIVKCADESRPGYMGWETIRELEKTGLVEFGCHTYDKHDLVDGEPVLAVADAEDIKKDLAAASKSFLKELGKRPDILAWPYGYAPKNLTKAELKELGFEFMMNTTSGINFEPIDFGNLKRFAALEYETPEKLYSIITGYDDLGFLLGK